MMKPRADDSPETASASTLRTVLDENENVRDFLPKRRSIPIGFDFDLEELWWPLLRQKQKQKCAESGENDAQCRTVPMEYYSRHQLLRTEGKAYASGPSGGEYLLSPTMPGVRGSAPIYSYRPGNAALQTSPAWPSRAHDGSTPLNSSRITPERPRKDTPNSLNSEVFHY